MMTIKSGNGGLVQNIYQSSL